ncbi:hypothetical protein C8R43DRAFT_958110 [Mycena crocata]|nr:hypothetical protein C8R43DRAFT_958110 [Mycena crocata]
MSTGFLLTAEYFQAQIAHGLTLAHLRHIVRTHKNLSMLKPTPKNVSAGIVLCVKAAIRVDWDFIQSTEDNPARKVETFMRLLLHEGKIHLPASLSLSDSPLSSPPSSPHTAPPPRPASAMSGVEVDPATLLNPTSVADNVDTVMADRDTNEEGEGLGDRDTDEEGEGQGLDGQEEEVKVKETSSWYGHIDDYDENIEWELIVFDPKVDQEIETPKIILINYANRGAGQMSVHRFNFLRFAYHTNSPEPADPSEECTARTFNATTVSAVRNALKKVWPGGVTFDVFWCLPGYSLMQEFGPVATHYAHSPGTIVWQVGPKHTIPILGPEEALRVLLVIREHYPDSDDDNDDNIQQGVAVAVAPVPTRVSANPGANIPAVPPPPYVQNPGPVIPQGQIPVQPVAPVAIPAPLIAPPVVPVVPLAQAGQNIAQINAVIVQQVHDVRVAHARVPDNAVGAGVAVGRVISGQNIGELFLRSQQWIKQALSIYDLYEAKKDRQQVKDLVATGQTIRHVNLKQRLLLQHDEAAFQRVMAHLQFHVCKIQAADYEHPSCLPLTFWMDLIDELLQRFPHPYAGPSGSLEAKIKDTIIQTRRLLRVHFKVALPKKAVVHNSKVCLAVLLLGRSYGQDVAELAFGLYVLEPSMQTRSMASFQRPRLTRRSQTHHSNVFPTHSNAFQRVVPVGGTHMHWLATLRDERDASQPPAQRARGHVPLQLPPPPPFTPAPSPAKIPPPASP